MDRKRDGMPQRISRLNREQLDLSTTQYSGADNYVVKQTSSSEQTYTVPAFSVVTSTITFTADIQPNAFAELNYIFGTGTDRQVLDIRVTRDISLAGGDDTTWLVVITNNDISSATYKITWVVSSFDEGSIYVF